MLPILMSPRSLSCLASFGALLLACAPVTTAPDAKGPPQSPPPAGEAAAETCLLGPMRIDVQQRMIQDNGITALLEDQHIGDVSILFAAQRQALADRPGGFAPGADPAPQVPPPPASRLLLARGAMLTEEFDDLGYVDNGKAKPTETRTARVSYNYFLADAAWDCEAVAAEIDALSLPKGQVGTGACVPLDLRARCQPVVHSGPPAPSP